MLTEKTCLLKKTTTEHFTNKKTSVGRGRFFKKIEDDLYKDSW